MVNGNGSGSHLSPTLKGFFQIFNSATRPHQFDHRSFGRKTHGYGLEAELPGLGGQGLPVAAVRGEEGVPAHAALHLQHFAV